MKNSSVNEIQLQFMESNMNCKTEYACSLFSALPRTEKPQARIKTMHQFIWKEDWHPLLPNNVSERTNEIIYVKAL